MIETLPQALPVIVIILLAAILLLLSFRRLRAGVSYLLRPLGGYTLLGEQVGRAVESGRQLHVTLGRAPLQSGNGPVSAASLEVLAYLAGESSESGLPPQVTVGDATLLPAVKGEVYRAYAAGGAAPTYARDDIQFLAASDFPLAYAAGVAHTIHHGEVANNVAVGRFGPEMAIIAEAAWREGHDQVLGSDDPVAMAVATLYTENVLWGEEVFTAGAYLEGKQDQLASVRAQDLLRWLVAGGILLATLLNIAGVL